MSGVDRRDFLKTATLAATMGAVSARAPAAAQDAPAVDGRGPRVLAPYETYVHNGLVDQNTFIHAPREESDLPTFEASRSLLPDPIWEGHSAAIDCYWKTWELAFANLRRPPRIPQMVHHQRTVFGIARESAFPVGAYG